MKDILELAKAIQDEMVEIRRELHMYPEISQHEEQTAEIIKKYLNKFNIPFEDNVGGYGIIATIEGGKPGKTVGLRADMDALQMEEQTDLEFKSRNKGVMHSCGHDIHMTFLLGAGRLLNDHREEIAGTIKLIFQPAEELSPIGGSRGIIESGKIDSIDAIFGLHVWPDLPFGKIGIMDGEMMASSDQFEVIFKGKSSHAARPHEGTDAIVMGSQFVNALQVLISRQTDPMDSAVLTVGKFNAGTRYNIVADSCILEGTCRTFKESTRQRIERNMGLLVKSIAEAHDGEGILRYNKGYLAVVNDKEMAEIVRKAATRLFTKACLYPLETPSMTGEDFSFYLQHKPGAFLWLGIGKDDGTTYPLHNPKFYVDEDIIWRGISLMYQIAREFLEG
ncbi:MAG: amidohydrolase [Tissierellia bacterium]|nr:amidohydrolase [Tissierellia bacterium]